MILTDRFVTKLVLGKADLLDDTSFAYSTIGWTRADPALKPGYQVVPLERGAGICLLT